MVRLLHPTGVTMKEGLTRKREDFLQHTWMTVKEASVWGCERGV